MDTSVAMNAVNAILIEFVSQPRDLVTELRRRLIYFEAWPRVLSCICVYRYTIDRGIVGCGAARWSTERARYHLVGTWCERLGRSMVNVILSRTPKTRRSKLFIGSSRPLPYATEKVSNPLWTLDKSPRGFRIPHQISSTTCSWFTSV